MSLAQLSWSLLWAGLSAGALGWMWDSVGFSWALGHLYLQQRLHCLQQNLCLGVLCFPVTLLLLFCAAEALRAMLLHPFKAKVHTWVQLIAWRHWFMNRFLMPFFQESTREIFFHMELILLVLSVPFYPLWQSGM